MTSGDVWYLDTSAAVKLVRRERGSAAMRRWMAGHRVVSSDLLRTELARAARRDEASTLRRSEELLEELTILRCDIPLFDRAGAIEPLGLRSLDALHLAAAESLGPDLAGIVTYDQRLVEAASHHDIPVASPG